MEERTMYNASSASTMKAARHFSFFFFFQEKLHSKWFATCLSSARSLGKEGHTSPCLCLESLNLGDNKKEKTIKVKLTVWQQ